MASYDHKKINANDVVVKNICCGLCGSDLHTLRGNWGPFNRKDLVVGHEIIGHVIAVGDQVEQFKVGDRVGIGAKSSACGECNRCKTDNEQYCTQGVGTYNTPDSKADGYVSQGGYSSHSIAHEQFVFAIPDQLESVHAAPLMCAGLTVFSPLKRNIGHREKPVVGIIGIGGLGHLAIQFAKALGAEVYAFSRSYAKEKEAKLFGAHGFIATLEDKDWAKRYNDKFDFILNCASDVDGFVLDQYLSVLTVDGRFCSVGLPPVGKKFEVTPFTFLRSATSFGASLLGSKVEAIEMLKLAADKGIKPMIEEVPIDEASCGKALERCEDGDVRYRFVFTEFDKAFKQ